MAIVQIGSVGHTAANSASSALTATASGDGILVVGWGWGTTAPTFAAGDITDNKGNTYALVGQGTAESGARCAIWCCAAPVSGVTSVTLTNANLADTGIYAYEISGQPATNSAWIDAVLAGGNASNVSTATTGALTTGANANLVVAVMTPNFQGNQTITSTGTSFTADGTVTDNTNFQAGQGDSRTASVASASITENWTLGGAGSYSAFAASFNAAAGGGTTNVTGSDTATVTDTATRVGLGQTDTGSATDTASQVGLGTTDSASATDAASKVGVSQTDTATESESASTSATTSATDSASVTDAASQVGVSQTDSAAVSESALVSQAVGASDTATATDTASKVGLGGADASATAESASASASATVTDTSGVTDTVSQVATSAVDTASESEAAQVQQATAVAASDSAAEAESASVAGSTAVTDSAAEGESSTVSATVSQTDTSAVTDGVSQIGDAAADTSTVSDTASVSQSFLTNPTASDTVAEGESAGVIITLLPVSVVLYGRPRPGLLTTQPRPGSLVGRSA